MDQQQSTIRVNLPDGRVVHFPASMSDGDISSAVASITKPEKSVGDFLGNVAESAGRFVVDTARGVPSLARGFLRVARAGVGDPRAWKELGGVAKQAPQAAAAIGEYAKERYGSPSQILETAYNDPVGVLADVSTIASGGATAPGRTGRIMARVEKATNPARVPAKATGRLVTQAVAPATYGMGLSMTPTMKRRFPNTAKRGVQEGIVSSNPDRVQRRLSQVEEGVTQSVADYDGQRPNVRGYLPPARQAVPLGASPHPSGERPAVARAEAIMRPVEQPGIPSQSREGLDALLDARTELGPAAGTVPPYVLGASPDDVRLADTLGAGARALPDEAIGRAGTPPRVTFEPQYLGTPDDGAIASQLDGPGVMFRDADGPGGPGAPPGMIDPRSIARAGHENASAGIRNRALRAGPMAGVNDATEQFLRENNRPMTATRTLSMKRAEQDLSNRAYRAQEMGQPVNDVDAMLHEGWASGARQELIDRIPGLEDELRREQELIGLLEAAKHAENRPPAWSRRAFALATGAGGVFTGNPLLGLAGASAIEGVRSPLIMNALGIGMDRAARMGMSDPAIRAAILARLVGQDDR